VAAVIQLHGVTDKYGHSNFILLSRADLLAS